MQALSDICKTFAGHAVLKDLDLKLTENGINCLLGASGCGKSTLLRVAAGLLPADSGKVYLNAAECAVVFQEPRLLPWLTVKENLMLALPPGTDRHDGASLIGEVLHQVHLGAIHHHVPRELSGGMAQRVGIARALLRCPRVLLMDEPFAALDALTRGSLQTLLQQLIHERQITCVFVTHDIHEATLIGDQVSILRDGRVVKTITDPRANPDFKKIVIEQLHLPL